MKAQPPNMDSYNESRSCFKHLDVDDQKSTPYNQPAAFDPWGSHVDIGNLKNVFIDGCIVIMNIHIVMWVSFFYFNLRPLLFYHFWHTCFVIFRWKIRGTKTWSAILNSIQKIDALDQPQTPIKKRLHDTVLTPSPTKKPKIFTPLKFNVQLPSSSSVQMTISQEKDYDILDDAEGAFSKDTSPLVKKRTKGSWAGKNWMASCQGPICWSINPSPCILFSHIYLAMVVSSFPLFIGCVISSPPSFLLHCPIL